MPPLAEDSLGESSRLALQNHSVIRCDTNMSVCHMYCVAQAYLTQWLWLARGTLFTGLAAFCFGGQVSPWCRLDIVFGESVDVSGSDNVPKLIDRPGFSMGLMLTHEAKEKVSSLSNEEFFAHGEASMRGQGNEKLSKNGERFTTLLSSTPFSAFIEIVQLSTVPPSQKGCLVTISK